MAEAKIKQGDRLPVLDATLVNEDGTAFNLTSADSVAFRMRAKGATTFAVEGAATIVSAAAGTVRYAWAEGDTDVVGVFYAEFVVTFSGSLTQTVPTTSQFIVRVYDAGIPG